MHRRWYCGSASLDCGQELVRQAGIGKVAVLTSEAMPEEAGMAMRTFPVDLRLNELGGELQPPPEKCARLVAWLAAAATIWKREVNVPWHCGRRTCCRTSDHGLLILAQGLTDTSL
jgi:hypothetical protein